LNHFTQRSSKNLFSTTSATGSPAGACSIRQGSRASCGLERRNVILQASTARFERSTTLSLQEIAEVLRRHLDDCRHLYMCGSADGLFFMVQRDVRAALERKYPTFVPEAVKPQPRRRRVVKISTGGGAAPDDVLIDGDPAAPVLRGRANPAEPQSILRGYEESREGFGADLED
jgi:hypothetical protein